MEKISLHPKEQDMNYKYQRECLGCSETFKTNYWNKKYCGLESCEKIRRLIKGRTAEIKRSNAIDYKIKLRQNYMRNQKRILEYKRYYYRKQKGLSLDIQLSSSTMKKRLNTNTLETKNFISLGHKERSSQRLDYQFVKSIIENEGYLLLNKDYKNNMDKLKMMCPEGHITETCFMSFNAGHRCSECAKHFTQSNAEREIIQYFRKKYPSLIILESVKVFNNSKHEIDIFFPEQKVAVEYCGLHWHAETILSKRLSKNEKYYLYHRNKLDSCINKNIRLITIFEDEYLTKPNVVLSRITYALGFTYHNFYARKCFISEIDKHIGNEFFEQYHLQGKSPCKKIWGLQIKNQLLQVVSVGSLSRAHAAKNKKVLELKRFATLPFIGVTGGFSKLLKQIINYAKENSYDAIKSYADMRYANPFSIVYDKTGFILENETRYTPHYVLNKKRYRNQTLRKTPEERLTGKTEWQLRQEQGFDRIWDCGHRTYIYYL